jgi:hypothetical protein
MYDGLPVRLSERARERQENKKTRKCDRPLNVFHGALLQALGKYRQAQLLPSIE